LLLLLLLVYDQSFQEHFVFLLDGIGHYFGREKLLAVFASRAKTSSHENSAGHKLLLVSSHLK